MLENLIERRERARERESKRTREQENERSRERECEWTVSVAEIGLGRIEYASFFSLSCVEVRDPMRLIWYLAKWRGDDYNICIYFHNDKLTAGKFIQFNKNEKL